MEITTDHSNVGVEVLYPRLNLMSVIFDLDDTCIKYLRLNLWLGPRGDEGTYRVKVAIRFHSPEHPNVSKVKGSVYFVVFWNGLNRLGLKCEVLASDTAKKKVLIDPNY
jgi:hypothetical protein